VKHKKLAAAFCEVHQRHLPNFGYVLSDGEGKSIRDLLSHYEYISAGTVNLTAHGLLIAGGGEDLAGLSLLAPTIRRKAHDLQSCISDMIDAFITHAQEPNPHGD
jgi:hypothetical protein